MSGIWVDHQLIRCCDCGHEWMADMLQNVAIKVWIAHIKSLRCPKCGAGWRSIMLTARAGDAPVPGDPA